MSIISVAYAMFEKLASTKLNLMISEINAHTHDGSAGVLVTTGLVQTGDVNQSIDGVKTFSHFPVTPSSNPSTSYQVANKKYVDDLIPTVPSIPTASSYGTDGYANIGGLILQWGTTASMGTDANTSVTFPISFPTACYNVQTSSLNAYTNNDDNFTRVISKTTSGCVLRVESCGSDNGTRYIQWFAVGK
jgi:hypothetical protein